GEGAQRAIGETNAQKIVAGCVLSDGDDGAAGQRELVQPTAAVVAEGDKSVIGSLDGREIAAAVTVGDPEADRIDDGGKFAAGIELGLELILGGVGVGGIDLA